MSSSSLPKNQACGCSGDCRARPVRVRADAWSHRARAPTPRRAVRGRAAQLRNGQQALHGPARRADSARAARPGDERRGAAREPPSAIALVRAPCRSARIQDRARRRSCAHPARGRRYRARGSPARVVTDDDVDIAGQWQPLEARVCGGAHGRSDSSGTRPQSTGCHEHVDADGGPQSPSFASPRCARTRR